MPSIDSNGIFGFYESKELVSKQTVIIHTYVTMRSSIDSEQTAIKVR